MLLDNRSKCIYCLWFDICDEGAVCSHFTPAGVESDCGTRQDSRDEYRNEFFKYAPHVLEELFF